MLSNPGTIAGGPHSPPLRFGSSDLAARRWRSLAAAPRPFMSVMRSNSYLGVGPAFAPGHIDLEGHIELGGIAHDVDHDRSDLVAFGFRHLDQHLVVDLQDQPAADTGFGERSMDPYERDLEDV